MSRMTPRLIAVAAACAAAAVLPAAAQAFNPQPDPPGVVAKVVNPGVIAGLNPQPLPPGVLRTAPASIPPDPYRTAAPAQGARR
ncbi:MAG: hypothetical protein QOD69_415 [Solirubrobacteraceae bacterium]|jgi:hypothetical protein|nr:hypothetical protein [Solirubrobacteraceae bacterium]